MFTCQKKVKRERCLVNFKRTFCVVCKTVEMASMRCIWWTVNCTFDTALMDQLNRCVFNVRLC